MREVSVEKVEIAIIQLLHAIQPGWEEDEELRDTPCRVAQFYQEFFTGEENNYRQFTSYKVDQMVVVSDIPFYSLCAHHLLPFFGTVTVGYITGKTKLGLSKMPRIVRDVASGLQTQEAITGQIANRMVALGPSVAVVTEGQHLCMLMRGVKSDGVMTTSDLRGVFREAAVRQEFFSIRGTRGK